MNQVWLGTSGFSYPEWRQKFYPGDLPQKEFLRYYASRLNSVEIDSTFYRMPNARTLQTWRDSTTENFRFALKASQRITHVDRLQVPSPSLNYLLGVVPNLEGRLGLVLYQLPPSFKCDLARLNAFLSALKPGVRSAFEFRHDSWYRPETYVLLRESRAALCIHDADDRTTPLEVTAPFVYLRLRRSQYDARRRETWIRRMGAWVEDGLEVFAYVKHEDNPDAPLIAQKFAEELGVLKRAA
jgi:uncharacterized protein YecE (DUF72 family)